MTTDAWITLAVVAVVFGALVRNLAPPDLVFLGSTAFLALVGIISPEEAFAGFSNPGVLTIAVLFVVAAALRETGVLDYLGHRVLGAARTERGVLTRLAWVVVPMSAFVNNTPVVAMFVPVVIDWCRRHRVSPSRLLIPLSYLAILGGTCTLIGTSTNLVVNGMMLDAGMRVMHLFEITKIGLPYALIGFAYLYFVGPRVLPDRLELLEQLGEARREYLAEMLIEPGCRLVGQTVEGAGLRHLPGLFLVEIDRGGHLLAPVGPDDVLAAGDRLIFTGVVSSIVELEKIAGLVPADDPAYEVSPQQQRRRRLCEAVVSIRSPLIGKTIRDADFRATYGAAVIAVHRGGSLLKQKIGDVRLRPGDTLLLQARPHFPRAYRNDPAFYLVSAVEDWRALRRDRAWIALTLFAGLIVLMTTGWVPTLVAGSLAAVLMVGMGCIAPGEARRSIDWQVLVTIAAAFGLGTAMHNSGAAEALAQGVVGLTAGWGPMGALTVMYLLGMVMTMLITNNAAAVLLFPICVETARLCDTDPRPFLVALILAASASFMTPIGYQTNMMVYGPGGYRFADFLRSGTALSLILWLAAMVLIPTFWPF